MKSRKKKKMRVYTLQAEGICDSFTSGKQKWYWKLHKKIQRVYGTLFYKPVLEIMNASLHCYKNNQQNVFNLQKYNVNT